MRFHLSSVSGIVKDHIVDIDTIEELVSLINDSDEDIIVGKSLEHKGEYDILIYDNYIE